MRTRPLYGIVQHSFGLQVPEGSQPFRSGEVLSRVAERFERHPFSVHPVGGEVDLEATPHAAHSPLAQRHLTTLQALEPSFIGPASSVRPLPEALWWAYGEDGWRHEEPNLIFADEYDRKGASRNDFLVDDEEPEDVSRVLLELMGHKRSRLFGFRLANRFVNVLLPHALLFPREPDRGDRRIAWFAQPLLSFIRGGRDRDRLRSTYSLTFFLIPVMDWGRFGCRAASALEIAQVANAGWGFAATPSRETQEGFDVRGKLFEYLTSATGFPFPKSAEPSSNDLPLRRVIELSAFGVGLVLAQKADLSGARLIGNDVLMSLGSTRVSSVVVRDDSLSAGDVRRPMGFRPFPPPLAELAELLAEPLRPPHRNDPAARKHRLDRPLVDDDFYAIGVVPTKRCLVVTSSAGGQCGIRDSALMQAGSIAYMTIGAAMAIGTLRAIDRRLESLEGGGPGEIAKLDDEIAADLSEIYDLDITRESYREIYRRLRKRLGIARDYELLQDKMEAVYRATSTRYEERAQRQLVWLTAAIVGLSVFILLGTIILISKGGG
jgi:hypothetical protein